MTFEGFGEMFKADFADTCVAKLSAGVVWGLSGGSSMRSPGSEDSHRREQNFKTVQTRAIDRETQLKRP